MKLRISPTFNLEKFHMLWVVSLTCFTFLATSAAHGQQAAVRKQFAGDDWFNLSSRQRVDAVSSFIKTAAKRDIIIKKDPEFYCRQVDAFYNSKAELKAQPLSVVLKTTMIMEYDWDVKGADKDELARKWLGEDLYRKNKNRINSTKGE